VAFGVTLKLVPQSVDSQSSKDGKSMEMATSRKLELAYHVENTHARDRCLVEWENTCGRGAQGLVDK
jgi:hypothetical protein